MARRISGLTAKQVQAAHLIGTGRRQADAARTVGVRAETMTHWMKIPEFRAVRDEACSRYVDDIIPEAVQLFVEQIRDKSDKSGWLAQNAAGRLIALKEAQRQNNTSVQVVFGSMEVGEAGEMKSANIAGVNITDGMGSP